MLKDWLRLTRAEHSIIVFFAIIIAQAITTRQIAFEYIYAAIGPALITLGAFAWNDYFGLKSDRALKRTDRPLVSGTIKPQAAILFAAIAMLFGAALTYFVNPACFAIALLYAILSMAYDPLLKKIPLAGNLFIASSMSISFIYGNFAVSNILNANIAIFAIMAFFAGLGRELIITLRDVEGDKKIGAKTLPMLLGPRNTIIAASTLIYLAIFASLYPLTKTISWPYITAIIVADALFLIPTLRLMLKQDKATLNEARNLTLYALIIGIIAFATLAF